MLVVRLDESRAEGEWRELLEERAEHRRFCPPLSGARAEPS